MGRKRKGTILAENGYAFLSVSSRWLRELVNPQRLDSAHTDEYNASTATVRKRNTIRRNPVLHKSIYGHFFFFFMTFSFANSVRAGHYVDPRVLCVVLKRTKRTLLNVMVSDSEQKCTSYWFYKDECFPALCVAVARRLPDKKRSGLCTHVAIVEWKFVAWALDIEHFFHANAIRKFEKLKHKTPTKEQLYRVITLLKHCATKRRCLKIFILIFEPEKLKVSTLSFKENLVQPFCIANLTNIFGVYGSDKW